MYIYIYICIYMKNKFFFQRFLINKGNIHNPFHMKMNIVFFSHTAECSPYSHSSSGHHPHIA